MASPASQTFTAGDYFYATSSNALREDIILANSNYDVATGSLSAYNVAGDSQISTYSAGMEVIFKANHLNTGSATLNYRGYGAKALRVDGLALNASQILANDIINARYNGTGFDIRSGRNLMSETASRVLVGGTTSNADALHTHDELVATSAILTLQYNLSTATGTSVIAHGLSRTPYLVEVSAIYSGLIYSHGSSTGSSHKCIASPSSTYGSVPSVQTTSAIYIFTDVGNNNDRQVGTITFDSTNVTINWTKTASPTGNAQLVLTVFA